MGAEQGWIGERQPSQEWHDSHYSREADRVNAEENRDAQRLGK
jgi:hypothetical protein